MKLVGFNHSEYAPHPKYWTVVNPESPDIPVTIRLLAGCVVWMGLVGQAGDVYQFDWNNVKHGRLAAQTLVSCLKGERVPDTTPLTKLPPRPVKPEPKMELPKRPASGK